MKPATPPLAELTAGLMLARRQWQRLVDNALEGVGISAACTGPLLMIGRANGGIRQVQLAQQLGMEGPSLVRLLDRLCSQDLVRREADASDRRANTLWLTDAGVALVDELETRLGAQRSAVFGSLTDAEIAATLRVWQLLSEAYERAS